MIRVSSKIGVPLRRKANVLWKEQRLAQSTNQSNSSKGSLIKGIIAAGGVTTSVLGVIGYTAWSTDNRKFIQDTIPGSEYLLEPLLGPTVEPVKKIKPVESLKISPLPNPLKKKEDKEKVITQKDASKKSGTDLPMLPLPPPPPPLMEPEKIVKKEEIKVTPPPETKPDIDSRLASNERADATENAALSERLEEAIKDAQSLVTDALGSSERVVQTVKSHAEKAYAAIDSGEGHESLYAMAAEVAKAKKDIIKATEDKLSMARDKIEHLQSQITSGRESKLTKNNATLSAAEEAASELTYAISKIKSSLAEALRDSSVVNEFRDLVEASRTQFEAEVRSLLPEVKIGEKSDKLTPDELNLLLAHAHRKVLALQKALAKQQTVDKERFKDSVLRQREMETKLIDGKLNSELERQRRDLGLEHRHRLQQLRDDLEAELRNQLKRQAAAHSDHISDVLDQQEKTLETKWQSKLHDEMQMESDKYYQSLSRIQGDLKGLKTALKSRADADNAAHSAHELWLACESLKMALRFGKEDSKSWEEQLLPLEHHVNSIKNASGNKDPFVNVIISSLPEVALQRGIFTDEALKERFLKVDRVCRRVALIGENGGSLPRYLLSFIQSLFLVDAFDRIPEAEMRNEPMDADNLNTHDVLARVRYCIAKDDLKQAVRYLNLLRGEPRHVASDWLKEARLALETKQAADALMSHAAATGARAL